MSAPVRLAPRRLEPRRVGPAHRGVGQIRALHVGAVQVGVVELGLAQVAADHHRAGEVGVAEIASRQGQAGEIAEGEHGAGAAQPGRPQAIVLGADDINVILRQTLIFLCRLAAAALMARMESLVRDHHAQTKINAVFPTASA
jgi:hypothetical protein